MWWSGSGNLGSFPPRGAETSRNFVRPAPIRPGAGSEYPAKTCLHVTLERRRSDYWIGKVVAQHPAAGTRACPGSDVTLFVGVG
jgi:hypothetical protein